MPSHLPVAGLHVAVLHSPVGEKKQSFGVPMQRPPWQEALTWQRSPDVGTQPTPSLSGDFEQVFDGSSHLISLHVSPGMPQSFWLPPTHRPWTHVSPSVQNWPSSHGSPAGPGWTTHWPVISSQTA